MSTRLHIDRGLRTVFLTFEGAVTEQELVDLQKEVLNHPDFDASYNRLVDLRGVSEANVSGAVLRSVGQRVRVEPPGRCAMVATKDLIFGLSRMYQSSAEDLQERGYVFRDMAEARQWLGLQDAGQTEAARPGAGSRSS